MQKNTSVLVGICASILFIGQVAASDSTSLKKELIFCAKVADNLSRLTCFDKLALQFENKAIVMQEEKVIAEAPAAIQKSDTFAKDHLKKTEEEVANQVTEITGRITKLSKLPRGEWQISLDNGQKWQQKGSTYLNLKVGQEVVLQIGAFSAIYLKKVDSNKRIKVRRIK